MKLDSKIQTRSKIIFSVLTLLVFLSLIGTIYAGVKTGKFEQMFISPVRNFFTEAAKEEPTPTSVILPSITPTATPSVTQKPTQSVKQTAPAPTNCIRKNIREGEFVSNKCYTETDYEDLNYYLNQYNSAVSSVSFYETKVSISCSNNDFFKTCEQDKKDQQANLDNIPRYRSIIQGIIAKGK